MPEPMTDRTPQPGEGWKLVPVEPTEAMMDAAIAVTEKPCFPQDIYAAMLAAAPASPAAGGVDAWALALAWKAVCEDPGIETCARGDDAAKTWNRLCQLLDPMVASLSPAPTSGSDGLGDGRRICEALGFDPTNHHNALACPYCNPDGLQLAKPTSGSEAGGEPKGWAAVYDGQIKSCHRSRETCVADAEHYQAIHPVYLGPAWRHQED